MSGKADIISRLQAEILRYEGFKPVSNTAAHAGLGPIRNAFPHQSFPVAAVHEFLINKKEDVAATQGFVSALLATLMGRQGVMVWISHSRVIFPPALSLYGLSPERCIFIDITHEKQLMWAIDEALKCTAISAVVGEVNDLSFTHSRRLQLAVEQSQATGFIMRKEKSQVNATVCASRWRITSLPSESEDDLPGIGYPKWKVELLRVKNGKPDTWEIQWVNGKFVPVYNKPAMPAWQQKQTG